jgi:ADP-heptose:LPS heptosyltransferase
MLFDKPKPDGPTFDAVAVRLSALGDVVLTTGVLDYWLRTRNMHFAVITRERFAPVFLRHPAVPAVLAVKDNEVSQNWYKSASELARAFGGLPLIDLHGTGRTLLLASMWKGKYSRYPKFGFARRLYRAFRLGRAEARLLAANVPQRYALALEDTPPPASALTPKLYLSDEERAEAAAFLASLDLPRPFIALHPYATHENKAWPEEHWLALARLLTEVGLPYVVVGRSKTPFLKHLARDRDLTNQTSLRATIALLDAASALVTGDSGPMHMAGGVNTPVVALFGPTTRAWGFYPTGQRDIILEAPLPCRPCSLHGGKRCTRNRECLAAIGPETVLDAVRGLVAENLAP